MTKVSVIMSEYNTPLEYLRTSIKSILDQTFTDFEFIIIDDCGNNDLEKIVREYDDNRIRIIKNDKNRGLVYSLNSAVRHAKGKYLVRMDTDDIAVSERIEKLYDFISRHPEYSVVGSRVIEFSDDTDYGILGRMGERTSESIMRGEPLIHPSVIMKKNAIVTVGGYPDYKRAEDLALWCELLLKGRRLYVINDILLKYRVNPEDYNKRKLKYRKGEIAARLNYYPKLNASTLDYLRITRFVISSILPNKLVQFYRINFRLNANDFRFNLLESLRGTLRKCRNIFRYYFSSPVIMKNIRKDDKKIIVALAADYGNLGDIAITKAQVDFLKVNFPDYSIIPIPISRTYQELRTLRKKINRKDMITLVGGGNTGSLYPFIETQRQLIIKKFPNTPIIAFPQSIFYDKTPHDILLLKKARSLYGRHGDLTLFARDKRSFDFMQQHFPTSHISIAPDIVLWLNRLDTKIIREKNLITIALRVDKESQLSPKNRAEFINSLKQRDWHVIEYDTNLGDILLTGSRGNDELNRIWNQFLRSRFVITDRLHGVIFCVITGTPCIALDNSNGKVRAFHERWLKDVNYVVFSDSLSIEGIEQSLYRLSDIRPHPPMDKLRDNFRIIIETIKQAQKGND